MKTKTLSTGVVITYDNKGNIKTLFSPYYSKKKNNAVRGTILSHLGHRMRNLFRDYREETKKVLSNGSAMM